MATTLRNNQISIMFNSNNMQQQQQQKEVYDLKQREEEYRQAQRSGVEAVAVGRETLEQATRQGEQLEHADSLADETSYKLDKASRLLRGMTWSGWVANAFARNVEPPSSKKEPSLAYENVPDVCRAAVQALQNYHANVQVMEECETQDQKETLLVICNSMFLTVTAKLDEMDSKSTADAYVLEFRSHLALLRERQQKAMELKRPSPQKTRGTGDDRAELFAGTGAASRTTTPVLAAAMPENPHLQLQDAHLQVLSDNLGELGHIAKSLSQTVANQSETIDSLDSKAEHITEKSKMVTRRADRIIQKKSWSPVKPVFAHCVSIRHVASGRYLTVTDGKLCLLPRFQKETAVFGAWVRQGNIFGLQNRASRRWMGQNLLGSLACSAWSFGRREEWEADADDWKSTRLLCASVGWGAGGYVHVNEIDFSILLGGSGVEERKKADVWCISEYIEA
jgi:hypothetical protein